MPVTYALISFDFVLASIKNIRSGGIGIPACCVNFSIDSTRSACFSCNGRYLLNIGSSTQGLMKTTKSTSGIDANQKCSHQFRGRRRIAANRISTTTRPNNMLITSPLVQSQNHEPQPWMDCSYRSESPCQYTPIGNCSTARSKKKPGTKIAPCTIRFLLRASAKSLNRATTPFFNSTTSTTIPHPTETKYRAYPAREYATAFSYFSRLSRNRSVFCFVVSAAARSPDPLCSCVEAFG